MEDLNTYLKKLMTYDQPPYWDGHIHLAGDTNIKPIARRNVVLSNVSSDGDLNIDVLPYLRKWKEKNPQDVVLANGTTVGKLEKALEDNSFLGIGELIVKKVKMPDPKKACVHYADYNILETALKDGRPIYIHHDLGEGGNRWDMKRLIKYIEQNQNINMCICHLGCNSCHGEYGNNLAIKDFIELQKKYPNIWGDISWVTLDIIMEHTDLLMELDPNRIIVGSDLCHWSEKSPKFITRDKRKEQLKYFENKINNDKNIHKFFGLRDIPIWM